MAKKKLTSKKAKNGIEGTMGGLTDIGFNYNGAWGGTMAMGGGIPGAVGFTYARTGSIPSNGPYAKKTKASAQNGMEMKFYQEGLDWKPKNISQDGSIVTPYGQWEYPGEITTIPSNEITMQGVPYPVLGISDIGDVQMMYPGEDYTFDGESVTEYPMMQQGGRTPIYVDNPRDPRLRAYQDSLALYNKWNSRGWRESLGLAKGVELSDVYKVPYNPKGEIKNFKKTIPIGSEYMLGTNWREIVKETTKNKIKPLGYLYSDLAVPAYKKPVQPVKYRKPEVKNEESVKKIEQPKPVEKKQNVYEGTPVYSGTVGSGGPSALVGFANQKGDTTFIKPEDYERFGVPKYGREYIEKTAKKFKDGGISVNEADAEPIKKLDQLLNFTNYNDMAKAKKGKKLPKAQFGIPSEYNLNLAKYDPKTQMFNSPTGRISMYDTTSLGFTNTGSKMGAFTNINDVNNALGDMGGIAGASTQLLGGIQTLIEEGKQRKQSKQALAISDIAAKAATSRPVGLERKYVRPEDMLVNPGETGSPYGTGYDFLQMENGGFIGGNPTEIQNMYNPGDLYSDLGYEPLDDSNQVKQFAHGGKAQFGTTQAGQLGSTFGSFLGGGGGQQSGAGQVGSAVGGVAGNILLPGIGGPIGSALGGLVGGAIGARGQKTMEQRQGRIQANLGSAAFQQSLQGQLSAYMEDGGELKYLSHDWQPQVITKFGEYDVKDLLKAPKDADMLRAGGHLKEYTAPSESAMSTERPDFQMGGELQTHWGGYAEPISYNPYLPEGGETVMFRGQSHEESDGKGRTGIGVTYGNNPVEVERGEPAVKLKDGGTGEDSMVVFGNMIIPSYGASELNDPKAKGMKFKRYAEDLSKIENKANKVSDKALKLIDETDGDDQFGLLSLSTANIMMKGSDMKLKDAANKKQLAAGIQSAILDTAEELGLENDALAKGKIKPMKNSDMAKFGAKMETAQKGKKLTPKQIARVNSKLNFDVFEPSAAQLAAEDATFRAANPQQPMSTFDPYESYMRIAQDELNAVDSETLLTPSEMFAKQYEKETNNKSGDKFNLMDFANQLNPYIRPLLRNPLDPGQLAPEMAALATNVVEPVQAQQFRPMLEQTPTVSFQDQLNEIQAEANTARRLAGNNPSAQAAIAAQAAAAKNKVLGEQMRTNQMMQLESRRRNLATLNDATLKNLGILDQQFMRQAQARSATKAQAQVALSSIADKIARNKAETLQANVMSNMYPQYTFGPKGRIFNTGITTFNTDAGYTNKPTDAEGNDLLPVYGKKGKVTGYKVKDARNGSIVKAIKNL
jgi:hypothetical protein